MRTSVQRAVSLQPAARAASRPAKFAARRPTSCTSCSAAGHRGAWVPTSKVEHFIPRERLTLDYIRRFFHGIGQTEFIRKHGEARSPETPCWERPRTLVNALQAEMRYRYYSTFRPAKRGAG